MEGGFDWVARMAAPAAAKRWAAAQGRGEVEGEVLWWWLRFWAAVEVADDLLAVELVVVGEDVGVGHVQDFEAEDAGLLLLVDEGGVGVLMNQL